MSNNLIKRPYGEFGATPELRDPDIFLSDYNLAFELSSRIEITDLEQTSLAIMSVVREALGTEVNRERLLAASALTAEARDRRLRREDCRAEKGLTAIRKGRLKLLPPFSIKRIRRENVLLNKQRALYNEQSACSKALITYMRESSNDQTDQ
jgi:hypothetical protein